MECCILILINDTDGLVQDCCNSIANALEFMQSCTKPFIMTSSIGNIFRVTGPLCGEFTGHRWIPRTKASDAELWCFVGLIQSWGWWFETLSHPLRRHSNVIDGFIVCWHGMSHYTCARFRSAMICRVCIIRNYFSMSPIYSDMSWLSQYQWIVTLKDMGIFDWYRITTLRNTHNFWGSNRRSHSLLNSI